MNINDLRPGDVLLFSPEEGSFISWAITYLTDAPVSHAAMFYDLKEQSIIDEYPPKVSVSNAKKRFSGRKITVRRLEGELTMTPVINISTDYLNNEEPYDESGLYLVGMVLLFKRVKLDTYTKRVMINILKKITASIVKRIHDHQYPDKEPMVCSQFVAQCYANAGEEYKLKFKRDELLKTLKDDNEVKNAIEQVIEKVKQDESQEVHNLQTMLLELEENSLPSEEDLCRELKESLLSKSDEVGLDLSDEFARAVTQFAYVHNLLCSKQEKALDQSSPDMLQMLSDLNDYGNMFTSPGDLLLNCINLTDVGVIK